ncbi:MAG: dual specificity protein phosphatase family protein [Proteobacteria bacterium]|nr:dual specificity protein phosphatase family protein [Pseudomonadota bacterium]
MSGYQRNLLFIVISAALAYGCSDPPKACICPQKADNTCTGANDIQYDQNTNILASLIQISQMASQNTNVVQPDNPPPDMWAVHDTQTDSPVPTEQDSLAEQAILAANSDLTNDSLPAEDTELTLSEAPETEAEPVPANLKTIADASARAVSIGTLHGIKGKKIAKGMPRNSHQVPEGYWIGSKPTIEQLKSLHSNNIKLIVTASRMGEEDLAKIQEEVETLGMKQLNIPFGGKFPKPEKFMKVIKQYKPDQIYIHCDHGGDRSGALLAYLLVIEQGWSIPKALFAVLYPGPNDINGLNDVLKNRGFEASDKDYLDIMGMYSAESNGGFGGLKVRSSNYQKLVNSLIDAMVRSKS